MGKIYQRRRGCRNSASSTEILRRRRTDLWRQHGVSAGKEQIKVSRGRCSVMSKRKRHLGSEEGKTRQS